MIHDGELTCWFGNVWKCMLTVWQEDQVPDFASPCFDRLRATFAASRSREPSSRMPRKALLYIFSPFYQPSNHPRRALFNDSQASLQGIAHSSSRLPDGFYNLCQSGHIPIMNRTSLRSSPNVFPLPRPLDLRCSRISRTPFSTALAISTEKNCQSFPLSFCTATSPYLLTSIVQSE